MLEEIAAHIRERGLVLPGSLVLLGLSGGGDSVCLFHALRRLQETVDFTLQAVHVNHGLRGADADADEAFVRALCGTWGVELTVVRENVRALAKAQGASLEEAGRNLRFEVFLREARARLMEDGARREVRILLAHHANDQEETVFLHFLRGAGARGLSGMQECRPAGQVNGRPVYCVRPLLPFTHAQLLETLRREGYAWCEDATNREADCARNRLRLQVLPQIRAELSPAFTKQCARMSGLFAEIDAYLTEQADGFVRENGQDIPEGYTVSLSALQQAHPALGRYVLRRCVELAGGRLTDLSAGHVQEMLDLLDMPSGRQVCLPDGMRVSRAFDRVVFCREAGAVPEEGMPYRLILSVCEENGARFLEYFEKNKGQLYTKWFDYDKIQAEYAGEEPVLRFPRPGDYLVIHESGQTKTLRRYLQQEKIPAYRRDRIPVAAVGQQVLWVIGYRTGEAFHVTEQTQHILRMTAEPLAQTVRGEAVRQEGAGVTDE